MPKQIVIVDEPTAIAAWLNTSSPLFEQILYGTPAHKLDRNPSAFEQPVQMWHSIEACINSILSMELSDAVILVNAHCCFSGNSYSAFEGLRVVELLRMNTDFDFPILIYGWPSLESLGTRVSRLPNRWRHLVDAFVSADQHANFKTTHTAYRRLPAAISELCVTAVQLHSEYGASNRPARFELARTLIGDEQERLCRVTRHKYQNVLAAHRLLLGAFLAGDISLEMLRATAAAIGNRDQTTIDELTNLQAKWMKVEQEIVNLSAIGSTPQTFGLVQQPSPHSVLIVDDHYDSQTPPDGVPSESIGDFGWQPVYEALLASSRVNLKVTGTNSFDNGYKAFFEGGVDKFDLIILDVDLGAPEKSGLHLLQQIRSRDPFIPVLIMTSFDDAEVCQAALELQADSFFAKQLHDQTNRTSLDYYNKFVTTIEQALQSSSRDRSLYRKFTKAVPYILEKDKLCQAAGHFKRLEDGVLGELTKFFLVLRVVGRHHLSRYLLINSPEKDESNSFDELMLILLDAILAWVNWDQPFGPDNKIESFGEWFKNVMRPQDRRIGFLSKTVKWSKLRHGNYGLVTIELVRQLADEFLDQILGQASAFTEVKSRNANEPVFPLETWQGESLSAFVERARRREVSVWREHSIKSRMGSEAALLGGYLASSVKGQIVDDLLKDYWEWGPTGDAHGTLEILEGVSEERLLCLPVLAEKLSRPLAITLIDDHAKSNGWAYVAQLIHNNALLSNIEFEGVPSNLGFQEFFSSALFDRIQGSDLLLLDLRMPMIKGDEASIETGLRIAETVKSLDPLLPIVLLSAHNESITMRRAIALGATEFFPKEPPPLNNSALVVHYANQFSMLPRYLKVADDDWLKFSARCRALMINLENFVSNARRLRTTANLPAFFSNIINNQGIFSALPLAPGVKHSVKNVHISVAGHALWLLRRAVFFLSMHRERYLSNWLCYFAAAVPELRAGMLGYDQVWVNCAMLVEYLFNVVAFTRCGATEPRTPASRSSIEQTKLQSFLEPQFYALGMSIWETRNERRYTEERSRDTEEQMAREMISKSIDFLVGIGFCWPSLGVVKVPPVSLASLRDNLKRSIQRRDLGRRVAQMEELLQKSGQISRAGTEQAKTLQLRYDEYVSAKGELEAFRPEQILTERRLILAHLRPPLDGPISVDPLADLR